MIKFRRKATKKAALAIQSLEQQRKKNGTYNTPEVNDALKEMFYGKCYICEEKNVTSYQIEHLHSYRNNSTLKYDWNNLFLSCAHCNNTKLCQYEPILDCCQVDVDHKIAFRKSGSFGGKEEFIFVPLNQDTETLNTAALLKAVFSGNTPQKRMEAVKLIRSLRKELADFKEYIREYEESDGEDKEDYLCLIKMKLKPSSAFTAFKRWLIWDHSDYYPELLPYCSNDTAE